MSNAKRGRYETERASCTLSDTNLRSMSDLAISRESRSIPGNSPGLSYRSDQAVLRDLNWQEATPFETSLQCIGHFAPRKIKSSPSL